MASAAELAAVEHLADELITLLLQHLEVDEAVVHRQSVAHLEHVHQLLVVDVDGARFHVAGQHAHGDHVAALQVHGLGDVAGADLRALGVEQDGHRVGELTVDGADPVDDLLGAVVIGVGHVQAHHVHAGQGQLLQHLEAGGGGPDGADDLGAPDFLFGAHGSAWFWGAEGRILEDPARIRSAESRQAGDGLPEVFQMIGHLGGPQADRPPVPGEEALEGRAGKSIVHQQQHAPVFGLRSRRPAICSTLVMAGC